MTTRTDVALPLSVLLDSAYDLAHTGRWQQAETLLAEADTNEPTGRARIAVAAAYVAIERFWYGGDRTGAAHAIETAGHAIAGDAPDPSTVWDLEFLRLRFAYAERVFGLLADAHREAAAVDGLRSQASVLADSAPGERRRGWARMYAGLICDNLAGDRTAAPPHYEAALRAGETADDLLAREAQRHLGDHARDDGDPERAHAYWEDAVVRGARAGAVPGTLSQQLLLAILRTDDHDRAGARAITTEVARWADALGATRLRDQALALEREAPE